MKSIVIIVLQVGTYSCITKPGMEMSSVHLYTEDHRHPAVHTGNITITGREYVPVTLPCIPSHPSVRISVYKWQSNFHLVLPSLQNLVTILLNLIMLLTVGDISVFSRMSAEVNLRSF